MTPDQNTAGGNWAFGVLLLAMTAVSLYHSYRTSSPQGRKIMQGMCLVLMGPGVRIGIWAPALTFRDELPERVGRYADFVFVFRDEVTIVCLLVSAIGAMIITETMKRRDWTLSLAIGGPMVYIASALLTPV